MIVSTDNTLHLFQISSKDMVSECYKFKNVFTSTELRRNSIEEAFIIQTIAHTKTTSSYSKHSAYAPIGEKTSRFHTTTNRFIMVAFTHSS